MICRSTTAAPEGQLTKWQWTACSLGIVLLVSAACGKKSAYCTSSSQCDDGFYCEPSSETCVAHADAAIAPACPASTHVCAGAPPDTWSGPVARTRAALDEELVQCGEESEEAWHVFDEVVAEGECTCTCGLASDVICGEARIAPATANLLCADASCQGGCPSVSLPPGDCNTTVGDLSGQERLRVVLGSVESATCGPAQQEDALEDSHFAAQERACTMATFDDYSCGEEERCVLAAGEGFDRELCIYREGAHECPEDSEYSERLLRYQSITDERACEPCTCAPPTGSCGGTVGLGFSCATADSFGYGCFEPSVNYGTATYQVDTSDPAIFSCTPTGGQVSGEARPTGVVTFCCEPD